MEEQCEDNWLDYFPNEIVLMIFNYLSCFELSKTNFDMWEKICGVIGSKIENLNLKEIDSSFSLDSLSNLKSLIISLPNNFMFMLDYHFTEKKKKKKIMKRFYLDLKVTIGLIIIGYLECTRIVFILYHFIMIIFMNVMEHSMI